jgi:hypothetical protein
MKRLIFASIIFLILMTPVFAQDDSQPFLYAPIMVKAGMAIIDFTNTPISVPAGCAERLALLGLTFTRTGGSAATVDFYFQISADNGVTWRSLNDPIGNSDHFSLATNRSLDKGNTVRVTRIIHVAGGARIRLYKIVNNDKANNLTDVNATLLY